MNLYHGTLVCPFSICVQYQYIVARSVFVYGCQLYGPWMESRSLSDSMLVMRQTTLLQFDKMEILRNSSFLISYTNIITVC